MELWLKNPLRLILSPATDAQTELLIWKGGGYMDLLITRNSSLGATNVFTYSMERKTMSNITVQSILLLFTKATKKLNSKASRLQESTSKTDHRFGVSKQNAQFQLKGKVFAETSRVTEEKVSRAVVSFHGSAAYIDHPNSAFNGGSYEVLFTDKFTSNVEPIFTKFRYSEPTKERILFRNSAYESMKDAGTEVITEVKHGGMGTEMTPLGSSTTYRCHTPLKLFSPARHNTPADRSGTFFLKDPMEQLRLCLGIATGLPASPGAAVGQVVFSAVEAEEWHAKGKSVILVMTETNSEEIHAANGILTARGGMPSHAAVVARAQGKCCVCGCPDLPVNDTDKVVVIGDKVIGEGEWLSLNGSTGDVILGKQPLAPPALSPDLEVFMSWVYDVRRLKVMANADTPEDALTAINNDAQGIGLFRIEHMFFASDESIKTVRKMIMAATMEQRQVALDLLLPYQRSDIEGIFRAMDGCPVTIRLLDPPLHEFLPEGDVEQIVRELTAETGMTENEVFSRVEKLSEVNPMLGFRGCRLGISYPELTEMQADVIFQTAINMTNHGVEVFPEMMVPLLRTPQARNLPGASDFKVESGTCFSADRSTV